MELCVCLQKCICAISRLLFGIFHTLSVLCVVCCWLLAFDERERVFGVLGVLMLLLLVNFCVFIFCFAFFSGCRCLPPISKMLLVFFLCFCNEFVCWVYCTHFSCIASYIQSKSVHWTPFEWIFFACCSSSIFRDFVSFLFLSYKDPLFFFPLILYIHFNFSFAEFVCFFTHEFVRFSVFLYYK